MKLFVSLLILMSLLILEAVAQDDFIQSDPPTQVRATAGDKKITLNWKVCATGQTGKFVLQRCSEVSGRFRHPRLLRRLW